MTFWPLDVRLPVIPVTVVVSPELSWEAVVCCVNGETTKLLVGAAVSVGSMEEVVIEDDIDVVASICRCSSGSWARRRPLRAPRRRDRPPSRRFRNSDNRWETGLRRKLPQRRPPPQAIQIAPHASSSMKTGVPPKAPPDRASKTPRRSFQITTGKSNFFVRIEVFGGKRRACAPPLGQGRLRQHGRSAHSPTRKE